LIITHIFSVVKELLLFVITYFCQGIYLAYKNFSPKIFVPFFRIFPTFFELSGNNFRKCLIYDISSHNKKNNLFYKELSKISIHFSTSNSSYSRKGFEIFW